MGNLLYLDFETYYDDEFTLKKMSTPAYILDPRWETIMVSAKLNGGEHHVIDGPDFPAFLASIDAKETTAVTFNALFDCSILAWRYNFVPNLMIDAMGLARAQLGHLLARFSLKSVAEHLQLGAKGDALANMKGKRREQIKAEGLWPSFCDYALKDNILCEGITKRLLPGFPKDELRVMDLVLRACIEPRFVCDIELLREHLDEVRAAKAELLNACSIDQIKLMSAPKFALALRERGVTVKTKTSPTGREIPQFARTDPFMAELLEHDDEQVQVMAAARLGLKSTIEETRAQKLLSIAELPWPEWVSGNMPVPLRYGGTHTHRLAGDWGMNMQNLPADRKKDGKSKLRASLKAPKGHRVLSADLGQIECRISAWLCKAETLIEQFTNKEDPYAALASKIFGRTIDRKVDTIEGFIGKTGILGLGYGCGKERFFTMCTQSARVMGLDKDKITREICDKAVETYREVHHEMPATWRQLDAILAGTWWMNNEMEMRGGVVKFARGEALLPNGMYLNYFLPTAPTGPGEYVFQYGKQKHDIYGAKFLENIVQALARIVVMDAAVRLSHKGLRFVLQAHDELVFVVKSEHVDEVKALVHSEMIRPPPWAPDLPLTADVGVGDSYATAKS